MKYILLFALGALVACNNTDKKATDPLTSVRQDSINTAAMQDTANFTSIQWIDSTTQDLHDVQEGQVVDVAWKFKNIGTKPLVVANVTAGCGCTVAEKPLEPIAPGGEGVIRAKFNSKGQSAGPHTKNVTMQANTKEGLYPLNFKVNVTVKS